MNLHLDSWQRFGILVFVVVVVVVVVFGGVFSLFVVAFFLKTFCFVQGLQSCETCHEPIERAWALLDEMRKQG